MKILGFQKTTLLDFPEHIASIIFTGGCNLRCPYCQNSELLSSDAAGTISEDEVIEHLSSHRGRIEGLVITGGEPTLQGDLLEFCSRVKELGILIKLDTNGISPDKVRALLDAKLLDYIALDVKLPTAMYGLLLSKDAPDVVVENTILNVRKTIDILKNLPENVGCETRTTVCDELFDEEIMDALGQELSGIKKHFIQPYRDADTVLLPGLHTPSNEKLLAYRDIIKKYVPYVEIRGADL